MATQFLEANPDVRLDVLHQVAQVNRAVGVGKGRSNEDATVLVFYRTVYT